MDILKIHKNRRIGGRSRSQFVKNSYNRNTCEIYHSNKWLKNSSRVFNFTNIVCDPESVLPIFDFLRNQIKLLLLSLSVCKIRKKCKSMKMAKLKSKKWKKFPFYDVNSLVGSTPAFIASFPWP